MVVSKESNPIGSTDKAIQIRQFPVAKFTTTRLFGVYVITGHGLTSDIIIDGFRIEKGNANGVLNQLTDANQTVNVRAGIFLWDFSGNLKIDNCVFTQNYTMPEHGNGDGSCAYINSKIDQFTKSMSAIQKYMKTFRIIHYLN